MGDDEILVETAFRTFQVRVDRFASEQRTDAQLDDARSLAAELRFGLANFEPSALIAAQRLWHALRGDGPFRPRRADAAPGSRRFFEHLGELVEVQLEAGRLIVFAGPPIANVPEQELTVHKPKLDAQPPPLSPTPQAKGPLQTAFEVRFVVDEIGQAISGLEVQIQAGDRNEKVTTNAAGVALLDGTTTGSGTVTVVDSSALEDILMPRWARARSGKASGGPNTTEQVFNGGDLAATSIKAGVPNTVVIKPQLGKLFVELWDKFGRVRHANRDYTISGPTTLSGVTDENGRALHEEVPGGDYTLTLSVDFPPDFGIEAQSLDTPLVTLAPAEAAPQISSDWRCSSGRVGAADGRVLRDEQELLAA